MSLSRSEPDERPGHPVTRMRSINVALPEGLIRQLTSRAAMEGRVRSAVVDTALRAYLATTPTPAEPISDPTAWMDPLRRLGTAGTMAANGLLRAGIRERADLDKSSDEDLLALRNFGQSQLNQLYRLGWRP